MLASVGHKDDGRIDRLTVFEVVDGSIGCEMPICVCQGCVSHIFSSFHHARQYSCIIEKVKLDNFHFQSLTVDQHDLAGFFEPWHGYQPYLLPLWSFDDRGFEVVLAANEQNMRAFLNDELILVLEWIAPYPFSQCRRVY